MENARTTNEPGLPIVSEESSQVGGRQPQAEMHPAHRDKLFYMLTNLQLLTEFFISVGTTLWNFWCRGLKPLWHWIEVFVEGEYLQSMQSTPKNIL